MFCKKGILRNFRKFTGKHRCQSLFFNKVARLIKALRTPFLQNTTGRLLLSLQFCSMAQKEQRQLKGLINDCLRPLRQKCPNTESFWVRIFPPSDWIRRDTRYLSVFSPNVGKYRPEKTSHLNAFHTVVFQKYPENFAFQPFIILQWFPREICYF